MCAILSTYICMCNAWIHDHLSEEEAQLMSLILIFYHLDYSSQVSGSLWQNPPLHSEKPSLAAWPPSTPFLGSRTEASESVANQQMEIRVCVHFFLPLVLQSSLTSKITEVSTKPSVMLLFVVQSHSSLRLNSIPGLPTS